MYELPEYGTDVPKHVGLVKYHTVMYVCNFFIGFLLEANFTTNSV